MNNDRRDTLNWADEIEDGSFPPLPNFKGAGQEEAAVHKNAARGGNRVNKHPASSMLPMNYAKVIASRNLPRKLTRRDKNLIEKATSPVKEPVELTRQSLPSTRAKKNYTLQDNYSKRSASDRNVVKRVNTLTFH